MIFWTLLILVTAQSVQLSCGSQVNGITLSELGYVDVNAYYGLRFATAPRFTQCDDVTCDPSATINATQFGPICYQFGATRPPRRTQSDDCLLLDVYTPVNTTSKSKLQVFFWIHGGGNCFGSSTLYTGLSHLTSMDNVVVVSVQYRLGAYGYLATSELSREQHGFSGNYGIGDLVSALRFVNKEIVNFGGDPTRVTLIGQVAHVASIAFC
jgi:para-nitrobenzyl esterase